MPEEKNESRHSKPALAKLSDKPKARMPKEIGGQQGPEPTRFGDWEQKGRCTDF
jgi:hypothetical protein